MRRAASPAVQSVLGPLANARGGARSLLATLDAYFATGSIATATARRLHLSVRAVSYRLHRVRGLTGYDPTDPAQRFTLHTAVLGAHDTRYVADQQERGNHRVAPPMAGPHRKS